MAGDLGQIGNWLIDQGVARLGEAFAAMTGEQPAVSVVTLSAPPDLEPESLLWRQPLPPLAGALWLGVSAAEWAAAGEYVLRAVGVEDGSPAEQKSTFLELVHQALA